MFEREPRRFTVITGKSVIGSPFTEALANIRTKVAPPVTVPVDGGNRRRWTRARRLITFPGLSAISQVAISMSHVGPYLGSDPRIPGNRQYLPIIRNGQPEISVLMLDDGYAQVDPGIHGLVLRCTIEMRQRFVQVSLLLACDANAPLGQPVAMRYLERVCP